MFLSLFAVAHRVHAGPYWYWEAGDFEMIAGAALFESVDEGKGSDPVLRDVRRVSIRKSGQQLSDKEALCFVHFYRGQPVLMYCEPGRPSELSGAVWRRSIGSQHFQCISACAGQVPKRFIANIDG